MIATDVARRAVEEAVDAATADAADCAEQAAREEVDAWLGAVALCFGLPEGRRWLDPAEMRMSAATCSGEIKETPSSLPNGPRRSTVAVVRRAADTSRATSERRVIGHLAAGCETCAETVLGLGGGGDAER